MTSKEYSTTNDSGLLPSLLIPAWILCRDDLTDSAKLVYGRLLAYAQGELKDKTWYQQLFAEGHRESRGIEASWVYVDYAEIATSLGLTERGARKALMQLHKAKLFYYTEDMGGGYFRGGKDGLAIDVSGAWAHDCILLRRDVAALPTGTLGPTPKIVFAQISRMETRTRKRCDASAATLAEAKGISVSQMRKHIDKLAALELITVERRGAMQTNVLRTAPQSSCRAIMEVMEVYETAKDSQARNKTSTHTEQNEQSLGTKRALTSEQNEYQGDRFLGDGSLGDGSTSVGAPSACSTALCSASPSREEVETESPPESLDQNVNQKFRRKDELYWTLVELDIQPGEVDLHELAHAAEE